MQKTKTKGTTFDSHFDSKGTNKTDNSTVNNTEIINDFSAKDKKDFLSLFHENIDLKGNFKGYGLSPARLINYIARFGFYNYEDKIIIEDTDNNPSELLIIRIVNNFAEIWSIQQVRTYISMLSAILDEERADAYLSTAYQVFTKKMLNDKLQYYTKEIWFPKNTLLTNKLSISNNPKEPNLIVNITDKVITVYEAVNLKKVFWKKDTLRTDKFNNVYISKNRPDDFLLENSDIVKFIKVISMDGRKSLEESNYSYNVFRSTIGYLAHCYKYNRLTKAVILQDLDVSDVRSGGRGKGIFIKMFSYFNDLIVDTDTNIDASNFSFSNVTKKTQILAYPEVSKNFDFEAFFEKLVGSMKCESKGKNKFLLPYKLAPKFIFATNAVVNNLGESNRRRLHILEFSKTLQGDNKLYNLLGRELFDDWDASQWNLYFWFMFDCIAYFETVGLLEPSLINQTERLLIQETSENFVEWINKNNLEKDKPFSIQHLFNSYQEFSNDKETSNITFGKWLKHLSRVNPNVFYSVEKINNKTTKCYTFRKEKEKKKEKNDCEINDFLD